MSKNLETRIEQLEAALDEVGFDVTKVDPSKQRVVSINGGATITADRMCETLKLALRQNITKYPLVMEMMFNPGDLRECLIEIAKRENKIVGTKAAIEVPDSYRELTLNIDQSHTGRDVKYFMTTKDEFVSEISGNVYVRVMQMRDDEAMSVARKVVPQYMPRDPNGVVTVKNVGAETVDVFNTYVPPMWVRYKGELPDRLPKLFEKLVNHLFPSEYERDYFYAWLYESLFGRAYVYLILCGPGGTGKNRLKLIMRALHGHHNTVDGKRSTLRERFNSQLADSTLAWFDELHYDMEMENFMKEIQNDSISIERKGVDATRSTRIYASCVISNNKPRDNYIAMDARKFVPLQITQTRLDKVMTAEEIDTLTKKVENWSSEHFDIKFVAQIGRWIRKYGKLKSRKWPHLEYKGPMFYKLAHTSLSRWQKKAASTLIAGDKLNNSRIVVDSKLGYLWSTVADNTQKKNGDRALQYPDHSTVRHFFDIFVDAKGKKVFKTSPVPKDLMGDFYVKVINKQASILTEMDVNLQVTGKENGQTESEEYDL